MRSQFVSRSLAAFGAIYVVVAVVATGGQGDPKAPSLGASGDAIAAYAAGHRGALQAFAAGYFEALALLALVVFVAVLAGHLRRAEPGPKVLSLVVLGAGFLTVGIKLSSFPATFALYYPTTPVPGDTARALFDMSWSAFVLTWFTQGLLLVATAVGGLVYGAIPRWLAAAAGVLSIGLLVGGAFGASPNLNVLPEFLWLVWVLVASVTLVIRPGDLAPAAHREKVAEAQTLTGAASP